MRIHAKKAPAPIALTTKPKTPPPTTTESPGVVDAPAPKATHALSLAGWGAWVAALAPRGPQPFLEPAAVDARIAALAGQGVHIDEIGRSREGRAIHAGTVGHGPVVITVMAGAHPDEPTGTLTGLHLLEKLGTDPRFAPLLERITLHVVPQANPDGSARNAAWFSSWPDLESYFKNVARDLPKDDVEFGFPDGPSRAPGEVRPENRALATWLDGIGHVDHHASLHSMFLGGGALFLVTADELKPDTPSPHAPTLRFLLDEADAVAMPLHDKDRMGQKGFFRLGAGLQTAPTAEAMKAFFAGQETAQAFLLNSMQYVAQNDGCPFSLVSEIPLVYDPRISSQKVTGVTRAAAEAALADGLLAVADRLDAFAVGLPDIQERLRSMRNAAKAQKADLGRYGDKPATEGILVENDLNLLRREATLLAGIVRRLDGGPQADEAGERLSALVDEIRARFELKFPPVDVQMRLQIAAVLAGALDGPPPVLPAPTSRSTG